MLKLARTNAEAHLYMDLHPCSCGERRFARTSSVATIDGELASRYTGSCARCGTARSFEFRLPLEIIQPPDEGVVYGGPEPSELLDPGEWLSVSEDYARSVPLGTKLDGDALRSARQRLASAIAALDEVRKFAPPGAAEVPPSAFTTPFGRAMWDKEPGRFRVIRLDAVRAAYVQSVGRL
jgi:hypothetical protein